MNGVVAYFKVLFRYSYGENEEPQKNRKRGHRPEFEQGTHPIPTNLKLIWRRKCQKVLSMFRRSQMQLSVQKPVIIILSGRMLEQYL